MSYQKFALLLPQYTVAPPNKAHVGDNNINSLVLSFVYREVVLFSEVVNVLKVYIGIVNIWDLKQ